MPAVHSGWENAQYERSRHIEQWLPHDMKRTAPSTSADWSTRQDRAHARTLSDWRGHAAAVIIMMQKMMQARGTMSW